MNIIVRIFVTLVILGLAAWGAYVLKLSKPEPKSKKIEVIVPEVNAVIVPAANYTPMVSSFGTVQSYFETELTSEVNGKITSVSANFRVGEMVAKGDALVAIDASDFEAELATEKANLILMQSALAEEEVRAMQAAADWGASGRKLSAASDFVLRKPQMAAAKANIDSAMASVVKAEVDLERTTIRAPYDAVVTVRTASVGNFATTQVTLGTLVATEKAEIRIPLTFEQMGRIQFSEDDRPMVKLVNPEDDRGRWEAELTRMEPTVDSQNQVSYGIATINNPYSNKVSPLLVGSFVNVLIPSVELTDVYQLHESAIVNDQFVWLINDENQLVRADVSRFPSDDSFAYVKISSKDLKSPLRVVSRPLSNFRSGMAVKTAVLDAEESIENELN